MGRSYIRLPPTAYRLPPTAYRLPATLSGMGWTGRIAVLLLFTVALLATGPGGSDALASGTSEMLLDLTLERNDGSGGVTEIDFAPRQVEAVGQDRTFSYLVVGAAVVAIIAGGAYWRPRIGLRAYGGLIAITVGAGVLLFSVIGDSLGAGTEGFGRLQLAGLIGGVLLLDAGVIALRGQSQRFRAG